MNTLQKKLPHEDVDTASGGCDISAFGGTRFGGAHPGDEVRVLTDYGRALARKAESPRVEITDEGCRVRGHTEHTALPRNLSLLMRGVSSEPMYVLSAVTAGVYGPRIVQDEDATPADPCDHLSRAVSLLNVRHLVAMTACVEDAVTRPVESGLQAFRRVMEMLQQVRNRQNHFTQFCIHAPCRPSDKWEARLASFRNLKKGWNSYSAPAPSGVAIENAKKLVEEAARHDIIIEHVEPSAMGGVGVTFSAGDREVIVEFYNSGKAHALFADDATEDMQTRAVPTGAGYQKLLDEVRAYLHGQQTAAQAARAALPKR